MCVHLSLNLNAFSTCTCYAIIAQENSTVYFLYFDYLDTNIIQHILYIRFYSTKLNIVLFKCCIGIRVIELMVLWKYAM